MENTFFLHQIRTKMQDGVKAYDKGIVIKDDFESAKQGYHAYLGAYAYGNNAECDFVSCMITDRFGTIMTPFKETWNAPETEG